MTVELRAMKSRVKETHLIVVHKKHFTMVCFESLSKIKYFERKNMSSE